MPHAALTGLRVLVVEDEFLIALDLGSILDHLGCTVLGPAATVQRYVNAFNKSDEDGLAACFSEAGFILDGMAPHVWSGASATRDWHKDALAEASHLGVSDFQMTLGTPEKGSRPTAAGRR